MDFKLPKPQMLRQKSERDCSVPVFARLAGIREEEVLRDLPGAAFGQVTVDGWKTWLDGRQFDVLQRDGCPSDILPCAHLVALHEPSDREDFHWIYRDEDGDVLDPSPPGPIPASDSRMRDLLYYSERRLTLSVRRRSSN
jgi:hypothetical protein